MFFAYLFQDLKIANYLTGEAESELQPSLHKL
ncbi:hypothetical protein CsSME_00006908 [Camellia sinensis var. sinensis]